MRNGNFSLLLQSNASALPDSRFLRSAVIGLVTAAAVGSSAAMDLRQAYEAALQSDATTRAARASALAGQELVPQARAQLMPNLSLSVGRNYNDLISKQADVFGNPQTLGNTYYSGNQNLSLRQALYRPQLMASLKQAQAQEREVNARLQGQEQRLVVRVAEAYFDVLLAQEQLLLMAAQKANDTAQLDAARKNFDAGIGTRTDIDDAQARVDMMHAHVLEAEQNLNFNKRKLQVLTGNFSTELAVLDVERFVPEMPVPASLEQWVQMAEAASPEMAALRAQEEAARLEVEKTYAAHKPTLDAVAYWARTNSDSVTSVNSRYSQKAIGLQLTIPIYSGGYTSSTVRQAIANHQQAQEALSAAQSQLAVDVQQEFRGMTEGRLRIAALEQAVRSAEQAVISSKKSQLAGVRTVLDVLNAEQQKTLALRDLAQARLVYLISRLRLQSLAGQERLDSVNQANQALVAAVDAPASVSQHQPAQSQE